jgi:hypothetical protein
MNNQFNDIKRYGDDLNDTARMDESVFETQSHGLSRVWFLPIILFGGLVTTAIVLVSIYVIDFYFDHNFLMMFVNFVIVISIVIPVGAIGCGLLAGIGYAVTARITQFFPEKRFIFLIFLLQFALFFVARYMEYTAYCYRIRLQLQQMFEERLRTDENGNIIALDRNIIVEAIKKTESPFIAYYRTKIEDFEWNSMTDKNEPPLKMGKWGWGIEFLMAFTFALCSLAASGVLTWFAYCRTCRRFLSSKLEFTFPMRAPKQKFWKNSKVDLEKFQQAEIEAITQAAAKVGKIMDFLKTEQAINRSEVFKLLCEIRDEVTAEAKSLMGVPNAVSVKYSECNSCNNFCVTASIIMLDIGNKTAFKSAEIFRFTDGKFVIENVIPILTI